MKKLAKNPRLVSKSKAKPKQVKKTAGKRTRSSKALPTKRVLTKTSRSKTVSAKNRRLVGRRNLPPKPTKWEVVHDWGENLFTLYKYGDQHHCWPNIGMEKRILALELGIEGKDAEAIYSLWRVIHLLGERASSPAGKTEEGIDDYILQELTDTVGVMINDARLEKYEGASRHKAERIGTLFGRAVERIMAAKYQTPRKHTGSNHSKEIQVITMTMVLCEWFQCLPHKSEIIAHMNKSGLGYVNDRGRAASKWNDLFKRCGLETLKY